MNYAILPMFVNKRIKRRDELCNYRNVCKQKITRHYVFVKDSIDDCDSKFVSDCSNFLHNALVISQQWNFEKRSDKKSFFFLLL